MSNDITKSMAEFLSEHWKSDSHFDNLPETLKELDLEQAYQAQDRFTELLGTPTCGWKIAATNVAGQRHIDVTHPLAGRLYADRVYDSPASILLRTNNMLVAEAEFTFRVGEDIAPGNNALSREEVMARVDGLFPSIELPDSRFGNFVEAGAPNLVADNACGREFILGDEVTGEWRNIALDRFEVRVIKNGECVQEGTGADVLGDPRDALTWLVNHCRGRGITIRAGELITTGVVGAPVPISTGDQIIANFGALGRVMVSFPDVEKSDAT